MTSAESLLGTPPDSPQSVGSNKRLKQTRNKPTLSCSECVERKTKCDRGRPSCVACAKRHSTCRYSHAADSIAATERHEPAAKVRRPTDKRRSPDHPLTPNGTHSDPSPEVVQAPDTHAAHKPFNAVLRRVGFERERRGPFDPFGTGAPHPFRNYWTCSGGLEEVVGILPSKDHADVLLARYFQVVDPRYPIISRPHFIAEYEKFWSLPFEAKCKFDAAQLALHLAVYATGTQFMDVLGHEKRVETSQFYISASHQALSLSSYLDRFSISTLQTMVLTCYFLVSNNHVSDAWTFSGIIQRQASALQLNRDPDVVAPEASLAEKVQRCKLWQAIMFQDTGLALYLKLPPTSMHFDVRPEQLTYPKQESFMSSPNHYVGSNSALEALLPPQPNSTNDIAYLRSMWEHASFIQNHVCIPKSLNRPLATDQASKAQLIRKYRDMQRSWPSPFNSWDSGRFSDPDERVVRQQLTVTSSFFFVLVELYVDEDENMGTKCDVFGALEAGQQQLLGFFEIAKTFPGELDVWVAYHTRTCVTATLMANVLAALKAPMRDPNGPDMRLVSAKNDLDRYISILSNARGTPDYEEVQRSRAITLQAIRDTITVV